MENFDIFNTDYNHIGVNTRKNVYSLGLWHHSFVCWIIDSNGYIVFQLRSKTMKNYPNLLDVAAGGGVEAGESLIDGGKREIREELGLDIASSCILKYGHRKINWDYRDIKFRNFNNVYFSNVDTHIGDYKLQKEELGGVFKLHMKDYMQLLRDSSLCTEIAGYILKGKRFVKEKKVISINNFVPSSKRYNLEICEYLNGYYEYKMFF